MKWRVALVVVLFPVVAWGQTTRVWKEWRNSLEPRGEKVEVVLVREGRAQCVILAGESGAEKKAAEELQHWVEEMSGVKLEVNPGAVAGKVVRIEKRGGLGVEGYAISADGGNLIIAGEGRGIVDGVYALLEEDMGCRFYTNSSVRVPKGSDVVARVVPRTYAPQLKLRDPFFKVSFDPVWSLRNRTNAPDAAVPEEYGGHIDYGGLFVHTQHQLVPPEKYFKEHPEYYEVNAGGKRVASQLCTTNAEVRRIATEAVLKVLREHPETEVVSVSRLDVTDFCHCPACSKLRADEGSEMACQLLLVNEVAEAVEKVRPDVRVDTLAYLETVPVPKTVRPRKNVVIRLCNDMVGAWVRPFTPASELPVARIAREWAGVCDHLSVWDYHVNFSHYLAPMPNLDVMAANVRFWAENHAWGVMTQAGYQGAAERDEMKSWVMAKLMWDPSRDWEELAQDFIWGHYGKAAPALCEYEGLLAEMRKDPEIQNPRSGIRFPMDSHFLSKEFVARADEIFGRAETLAAGDEELLHRVERAELPVMYVKLSRGKGFAPDFAEVLGKFERVGKREGVTHLAEVWPGDFEKRVGEWKKEAVTRP